MSDNLFHESANRVLRDELPMVRKSLIIGMGGSGMKGIGAARSYIEENLPSEARRYMRWTGIDTTDIGTSIEGKGGWYRFPGENQTFQDDRRTLYIGAPTPDSLSIEYLRSLREENPSYDWLPDPDVYNISTRAGQGANQTRALGRLAFFHNYQRIRSALEKEKQILESLSNDPVYFQLMDVQEKSKPEKTKVTVKLESGKTRYYISDRIPSSHDVSGLEMDESTRAILCPHIAPENITPKIFPKDDRGKYFDMNPDTASVKELNFVLHHAPREGQISIFLTGSVVGGTGNGMFLDMAALIHDVFKDTWPQPKLYGIIVLPSAFKRVVYNENARANAYAALKEIDYFQSGNPFRANYPDRGELVIEDRLFKDGMLYLLDVENLSGNVLQGRDQVQELTGQFIYTFLASSVGGAIEERMVNDSTRASIYAPEDGSEPQRRASYNSFGISRVIYPVQKMREIGFKLASLKVIQSFHKPVNQSLLKETMGDLNRGLVRSLRLNCKLIFERMYPDYRLDWKTEFNGYLDRLRRAIQKRDVSEQYAVLSLMRRDYGRGEMENHKNRLMRRMQSRWKLELEKVYQVLDSTIEEVIDDPERGFLFCKALLDQVMNRLELYQETYYKNRIGLNYYPDADIDELIDQLEGEISPKKAEAAFSMIRLNHLQLIQEAMLHASEEFVRDFKSMLFNVRNDTLMPLRDKLSTLARSFKEEIQQAHFDLLGKINPLYFYLTNKKEIQSFINRYFGARLSIEDLCNEVNFLRMDRSQDNDQILQTYMISHYGVAILDKTEEELHDLIVSEFGSDVYEMPVEKLKEKIAMADEPDAEGLITDSAMTRIETDVLRIGLFKVINKRFAGLDFENISIKKILSDKKVKLKSLLEKLDTYSRPYTTADFSGLKSVEYFRTITQFPLNVFEEGDEPGQGPENDLPSRMDHYKKRSSSNPEISVECFEVPNLCKSYEIISIGIALGFPLYRVDALRDCESDYHMVVSRRSHPLHLFNAPAFNARYFPDPFRYHNYLNPKNLWNGLIEYGLLEDSGGTFSYSGRMARRLRSVHAGEKHEDRVNKLAQKVQAAGGLRKLSGGQFSKVLHSLGILKKTKSGKIGFRKEYDSIIRDIMDGDGTGNRADQEGLSKDEYIEKYIESPEFSSAKELSLFIRDNSGVRNFLLTDIERIFRETRDDVVTGASLQLPAAMTTDVAMPQFRDEFDFYTYFDRHGSLEWQNILKDEIVRCIDDVVRKFRRPDDPTLPDRTKIDEYLKERADKIPFTAAWEIRVKHRVIR